MARIDILDAIAGISGKTSLEVWESGNDWSQIIKNAESVLGKKSKWHILNDENGSPFMITGKNGRFINLDTGIGSVSQYAAGNQLVTDVIKEESGALTAYTGNITSATGEVTKKGLALGASTGAKVVGGALAAFGAVATGVNWYKDNPEFWTNVSQKLLPFAYKDPTDKSWGDIFYDALCPTAVDDSGTTYVPESVVQAMLTEFYDNNMFTIKRSAVSNDDAISPILKGKSFNYTLNNAYYYYPDITRNDDETVYTTTLGNTKVTAVIYGSGSTDVIFASENPFIVNYKNYYLGQLKNNINHTSADDTFNGKAVSNYNGNAGKGLRNTISRPQLIDFRPENLSDLQTQISYILLYGEQTTETPLDNIDYPDPMKTPTSADLPTAFPDWYKNAQTTVNPNWKPSEPESDDNPKYIVWLPLQIPDEDTPDGNTEPDTDQDTAQKGKPTPNPSVDPTTDQAINDGVLPDPNPNPDTETSVNPSPQPDPSPDPTPDPTDPDTPGKTPTPTPTPDVPGIGGGTANALWKIYNPSHSILQEFGAWLWSDNPIKLIKEIFGNNPADGIVGLHMIYVTPPIGGTANIKVGYVDSGVASPWVSQQYVTIDCGSVVIPMRYQSALDFGYTKVYCYLPFIGIVPLDSFDIIGKTVKIKYTVDILTGTVLAQISVSLGNYNAVLYTFNGSCSVEYPLTSGSRASQMLSLVTGAVGGAVVGGAGGALLGGVRGAASGADVRMSGNISGNAGAMGIRKPYIIVKRPVEVAARNYPSLYGYPANITGRLNTFSGYVRVKDVHVDNVTGATAEEKREIESLLKSGVIV